MAKKRANPARAKKRPASVSAGEARAALNEANELAERDGFSMTDKQILEEIHACRRARRGS